MRLFFAFVALLITLRTLNAQRSSVVPLSDPVYRAIDRLMARGLVDTIIVGQRPFSRGEVSRIVGEARAHLERGRDGLARDHAIERLLDDLSRRFETPPAPRVAYTGRLDLLAVTTNERPRAIPADTGLGGVDAVIAPLGQRVSPAAGRDALDGSTVALELRNELAAGSRATFVAHGRWRGSTDPAFSGERALSIVELSARVRASNVVASIGRAPLVWGQSRQSLFLSNNARALDMIWLGTDHPWRLPGVLEPLGSAALSFFAADLGRRQYFPHTKLLGYKVSLTPTRTFELGVSALDFVGGRGAPHASGGKVLENLFLRPFFPVRGFQFSNEMLGLEARLGLPSLGGTQIYWEMNLDDFDWSRVKSSLWTDDAGQVFGVRLPEAPLAITLEFHHTGTRFNRHQQFLSGPTVDRVLVGDPLGPDASGGYAFVEWKDFGVELATEVYRADQYTIVQPPMRFLLLERRPRERRHRAMVTARRGTALTVQAGIERVSGFEFVRGSTRTQAILAVVAGVPVKTHR